MIGTPYTLGTASSSSVSSFVSLPTTAAVAAGESIIVAVHVPSATESLLVVTDSAGNSYQITTSRRNATDTARYIALAVAHNVTALGLGGTITAQTTGSVSGIRGITALGVAGVAALDKTAGNDGTGTSWSTGSSGTLSTSETLAVAFGFSLNSTANTPTLGWTETADFSPQSGRRLVLEYQILSSTAAVNGGGTWGNAIWVGILATYNAGSPAIGPQAISSTVALGQPSLRAWVHPGSTASAETVGQPLVNARIDPAAIASVETIGQPLILGRIDPAGVASDEQVGQPLVHAYVDPTGVASNEAVGQPLIAARFEPTGIVSDEQAGELTIVSQIRTTAIVSEGGVGTPVVTGDTTGPVVTWGAQTGTTAGEFLQLGYTSDEPIASAALTLAGGQMLALTVGPTILSVTLPADAADGPAAVRVLDALGNASDYPALVTIHGVAVPVPAPDIGPRSPPQRPRPRRQGRRIVNRSRLQIQTRTARARRMRARIVVTTTTTTTTTAATLLTAGVQPSTSPVMQSVIASPRRELRAGIEVAVQRRDGPDLELLLLLLG